jgi:hypothetical protein
MIEAQPCALPSGDQHDADLTGGQSLPAAILRGCGGNRSLAIRQAQATGLTLIGFAREGRQTLYANPSRLQD